MTPPREAGDESGSFGAQLRNGLFYRGTIARLSRGMQSGAVRSASGREIPFDLEYVDRLGALAAEPARHDGLRIGMEVGYDVGWTSRGLRVTKLFAVMGG